MKAASLLIVDDSRTIRRALESILRPRGYNLEFAEDGREAIEKASSSRPDLILLDYVLPDMRGPDVCAVLSALPATATTPVILVSAKGASIRQAYQDSQNVVSYITKPFKTPVVLSVVANALEESASNSRAAPSLPSMDPVSPCPPSTQAANHSLPLSETFSTLLEQLEAAAAGLAQAKAPPGTPSSPERSLEQAREHLRVLGEYIAQQTSSASDPEPRSSFAGIAQTLLGTHRMLCETMLGLAAGGTAAPRAHRPPSTIIAVPAGHDLHAAIQTRMQDQPSVLVLDRGFESLPAMLGLIRPRRLAVVGDADPILETLLQRKMTPDLQRLVISNPENPYRVGEQSDLTLLHSVEELRASIQDPELDLPPPSTPMSLEVVHL